MANSQQFVAAVQAGGMVVTGWESITVKRSFNDGISTFQFATTENIYGPGTKTPQLQPGDPIVITLGGQQVINGKVTTRSIALDDGSHQVVISGKSLTKDVADSSVPVKPGNMNGSTLQQVANMVLGPHGVGLVVQNPPAIFSKPFASLALQYGETGRELLSRLAMVRGCFLWDDAQGNLVIGQGNPSAAPVAELQEGVNIKRIVGLLDDQTAFSQYTFASQQPDYSTSQPARWFSATTSDPSVASNRVKLDIAEHPMAPDELQARAGIEASRSSWPTVQVTITVVGWFKPDGTLWQPTENVSVVSPSVFPTPGGMAPPLGIQSVTYQQSSTEGTTTTLTLVLPQFLTSSPSSGLQDTAAPGSSSPTPSAAQPGGATSTPLPSTVNAPDFAVG